MKRLCIDVRFYGIGHTGIGRYAQNLVENLPKSDTIQVVLICGKDSAAEAKKTGHQVVVAKYHPYSLLSQIEMPLILLKINADLVHFTHFFVPLLWFGKYVVTIHDLIKHEFHGMAVTTRNPVVYFVKHWGYLFTIWRAVMGAKKILVPAKYWKEKLVEKYKLDPKIIEVTYEGVAHGFADH